MPSNCLLIAVLYFATVTLTTEGFMDNDGRTTGFAVQSYLFSTIVLLTVLLKFSINERHWVHLTWISIITCIFIHVAVMFILQSFNMNGNTYLSEPDSIDILHILLPYYAASLIVPVLCNLPDILGAWYVYSLFAALLLYTYFLLQC